MARYDKPAMASAEHLEQWRTRGLLIPDVEWATRNLSHISYYRLSAYAIPYTRPGSADHRFLPDTCFDDILSLYVFDRELRLLLLDAIERVEVAVRAQLCNHMSITYGNDPFWYLDESHFKREYGHKRLLASLERQLDEERRRLESDLRQLEKRPSLSSAQREALSQKARQETFLRHYLCSYDHPRLPPCWMMVEMLTWGDLSYLYGGLVRAPDQKAIARGVGTHAELLTSWLKGINLVRNICAHHARLWNRELGVNVKLPTSDKVRWLEQSIVLSDPHIRWEKRLYPVLVALQSLLYTISPASRWAERLAALLAKYPHISLAHMGIPANWQQDPFWQAALAPQQQGEQA